jgi:hypothetical protein
VLIDGVMLLWFVEAILCALFVAVDIRRTPEAVVMKWGFVIVTLYSGPIGALLYVLSCREPMPGTHEAFVAARWRQVVGSTMHCVAGDGLGILAGAIVAYLIGLPKTADFVVEYAFGFLFGWVVFQSLFMKELMGGSFRDSLRATFLPEFLSMNGVMGGMLAVRIVWTTLAPAALAPINVQFWFSMSIALTVGFAVAYPINWWLVSHGLKHGMMTVRPDGRPVPHAAGLALAGVALSQPTLEPAMAMAAGSSAVATPMGGHAMGAETSASAIGLMTAVSLGVLVLGILLGVGVSRAVA